MTPAAATSGSVSATRLPDPPAPPQARNTFASRPRLQELTVPSSSGRKPSGALGSSGLRRDTPRPWPARKALTGATEAAPGSPHSRPQRTPRPGKEGNPLPPRPRSPAASPDPYGWRWRWASGHWLGGVDTTPPSQASVGQAKKKKKKRLPPARSCPPSPCLKPPGLRVEAWLRNPARATARSRAPSPAPPSAPPTGAVGVTQEWVWSRRLGSWESFRLGLLTNLPSWSDFIPINCLPQVPKVHSF